MKANFKKISDYISFLYRRALKKIYTFKAKKCLSFFGTNLTVNHKCIFTRNTIVGNNCNFNGIVISGSGNVKIGDNFHSGKDCLVISQNHNYDNGEAIPYDSSYITKNVLINDNVWIGDRVIILGGVEIGEGAIIQAGSVVVHDIPPYAVAGGHPCKVFKYRDIDHYLKLKSEKKFF